MPSVSGWSGLQRAAGVAVAIAAILGLASTVSTWMLAPVRADIASLMSRYDALDRTVERVSDKLGEQITTTASTDAKLDALRERVNGIDRTASERLRLLER